MTDRLDKKKGEIAGKMVKKAAYDRSFGLPSGERVTPRLKNRFDNYEKHLKKTGGWGVNSRERHLHKQNSFYQFNKPEYDSKEYKKK